MQKDNTTLGSKVALRLNLLKEISDPVVMETHGGRGHIWWRCYSGVKQGIVFEKDADKASILARQRPSWAVYECDCVAAIRAGAGAHLPVNLVDIDPYGEPWPVIDALFGSDRQWPTVLGLVVNDGLRQKLKIGVWNVASMGEAVRRRGNKAVYENYLDVCRELVAEKAGQRDYTLTRWAGYYCGHAQQMTHYAALLVRTLTTETGG